MEYMNLIVAPMIYIKKNMEKDRNFGKRIRFSQENYSIQQ